LFTAILHFETTLIVTEVEELGYLNISQWHTASSKALVGYTLREGMGSSDDGLQK